MAVDRYGPRIEREMARGAKTGRGVTIPDICLKLGCVEGRVRQWLRANEHRVVMLGYSDTHAKRWALAETGKGAAAGMGVNVRVMPRVKVGEKMIVVAIKETGEELVIELRDEHGKRVEAVLRAKMEVAV